MKNTSLLLIACVLFVFACQNDPKPASTPETTTPSEKTGAPAPQIDLGALNQSVSDAKSNLAEIDKVNQEISKLPASVQKANKAIIESIDFIFSVANNYQENYFTSLGSAFWLLVKCSSHLRAVRR